MNEQTKWIAYICDILELKNIAISYDTSHFAQTMLAAYKDSTLYLKKDYTHKLDALFSIAHELRHAWQEQTDDEKFFKDYKPRDELNVASYNLQVAELDANAFASAMLQINFSVKPQFNGLSEDVKRAIDKEAKLIIYSLQ